MNNQYKRQKLEVADNGSLKSVIEKVMKDIKNKYAQAGML